MLGFTRKEEWDNKDLVVLELEKAKGGEETESKLEEEEEGSGLGGDSETTSLSFTTTIESPAGFEGPIKILPTHEPMAAKFN